MGAQLDPPGMHPGDYLRHCRDLSVADRQYTILDACTHPGGRLSALDRVAPMAESAMDGGAFSQVIERLFAHMEAVKHPS